jgi:hypothetical protein
MAWLGCGWFELPRGAGHRNIGQREELVETTPFVIVHDERRCPSVSRLRDVLVPDRWIAREIPQRCPTLRAPAPVIDLGHAANLAEITNTVTDATE